jgi:hypothetical protein
MAPRNSDLTSLIFSITGGEITTVATSITVSDSTLTSLHLFSIRSNSASRSGPFDAGRAQGFVLGVWVVGVDVRFCSPGKLTAGQASSSEEVFG